MLERAEDRRIIEREVIDDAEGLGGLGDVAEPTASATRKVARLTDCSSATCIEIGPMKPASSRSGARAVRAPHDDGRVEELLARRDPLR